MTLKLTPAEYTRLQKHMDISEKQKQSNSKRITPAKEAEVLAAIKADISAHEIQRELKVCNKTIIRVRKKNGLWGV